MKMLLLGAKGQVGWELQRSLSPLGELVAMDRTRANLENIDELRRTVQNQAPDIIVNAAAYTAVDKAESEPERTYRINAEAVGALAEETERLNSLLVHYSTDYVFDGQKQGFYREGDNCNPQSVYGKSKWEGELAIQSTGCRHLIFRTCWVYAARGHNFAKTMLRLARERDELKVVSDQIGAPTSADLIADITALVLYRLSIDDSLADATGIYHLAAAGEASWYGFAQKVIAQALACGAPLSAEPDSVKPILASEYPVPAPRPYNSLLDTQKLHDAFGVTLPDWRILVKHTVNELINREVK